MKKRSGSLKFCPHKFYFSLHRDRRTVQRTWERLGLKGPKASSLFLGNLGDTMAQGRFKLYAEWTKKYGKVFGYYEGSIPVLLVADPDMAREILIKQFDNFEQRLLVLENNDDPYRDIFEAVGEKWKRVRGLSTPTFSGKKMKMMSPLVQKSIDKLLNRFERRVKQNEDFDISEDFKCLTLDVIASTVFSYDTDIFNTKDSIFLKKLNFVFASINSETMSLGRKLSVAIFISFPACLPIAKLFWPRIAAPPNEWFHDLAKKMITERQSSGEIRPDYIQLLLGLLKGTQQANTSSETDSDLSEDELARDLRRNVKSKFLTMEEIQGQTFIFLVAGYETTATTLAFIAYYLALYPDVQAKLQEEIDTNFPDQHAKINYETVQALPYLEMVFCEVSRLAYIGQLAVQRMCKATTKVGDFVIPKGARVIINVADIHFNPELWGPEPVDQLVPERFLPERKGNRHPMAYLPFGAGPKNCIGMRFAIMEAKMALINILKRYNIERCGKTKVPLKCNPDGVHGPSEGVYVRLTKR